MLDETTSRVPRCRVCECRIYPDKVYRALTPQERYTARHTGRRRHAGRGLCDRDYNRAQRDGTLLDYPPAVTPSWVVLEEWEFMADPAKPRHVNVRELAPRFGMTEVALAQALRRQGVAA